MKKALLLSVVASSMIMAGGDIAPVEPAVEAPAEVAAWEFGGSAVVYYQTDDSMITSRGVTTAQSDSLFDQGASAADAGIQLRATNADVVAGIGAGVEVSALATLGLQHWMVSDVMQGAGDGADVEDIIHGGWVSQAYLTYGFGNTSLKVGRQELPKALSPFAFSEDWNVFKNTFDAVLAVNTDLPNTTLVGAWVLEANKNGLHANMADFNKLNGNDGVFMLTAQNKSIENLTLTGTVYYGADMAVTDDVVIWWGDAAYDAGTFGVAVQGGTIDAGAADDMTAIGVKASTEFSGVNLMAAYSTVSDGDMHQLGGTTSALYTTTVVNQLAGQGTDEDKFVVGANMDALGGNISGTYAYSDNAEEVNEFDLVYSTNVAGIDLTAAYVYVDSDVTFDGANIVRVVGAYNF